MCAIALGCVLLGGCGGPASEGTARIRDRVRVWLPEASRIDCAHRTHGARCDVLAGRAPGGVERWTCEFTFANDGDGAAYSGTESCWSDGEAAFHLHVPTG